VTAWARVTTLEASHFDFNTAYASVDRHQLEDFAPYIYRTRDRGRTWEKITRGLPAEGHVHVIREDPDREGLLFAGTERGVFISFDDGDHWQPLQLNLPVTSMRDVQIYSGDLILATHGRGIWVLDDISALRQADPSVAQQRAYLYQPSDAVLVDQGGDNGTPYQKDEPQAPNPPAGAYIDYWLAADATGPVTLEVLDSQGAVLETFGGSETGGGRGGGGRPGAGQAAGSQNAPRIPRASPLWNSPPEMFATHAGMHRVAWTPNTGGRRGFGGGGPGGFGGQSRPVVTLPGTFTVRLTVGGARQERTFTVSPDPRELG
jgi:hypothetical protein